VSISIDEKDIDKGIVHLLKKIEDERVCTQNCYTFMQDVRTSSDSPHTHDTRQVTRSNSPRIPVVRCCCRCLLATLVRYAFRGRENSVSISIDEKDIDKGIVHLLKKIEDEHV